jgi:phage/plasmid-like protein (TIGR03299 family)
MSHEIETHGDQAAAIFARTDAWHRLGTTVRGRAFTAEEAMTLGHLGGWRVRKVPLTATEISNDGVTTIDAPGFATVRSNPFTGQAESLGVVGDAYTPLQNEDHADFLNTLADQSGAVFDTAGSLRGGRQVFITMKLPETLTVGGIDSIDLNIAALNSHDGTSSFRILITPVRVVCANTQAAAIGNHVSSTAIRRTGNAKATVQIARETLGLSFAYCAAFEAEAERLIQTTMTASGFDALTRRIFGHAPDDATKRTRDADRQRHAKLASLFHDADTQANIRGTAWAGYQAVVEYLDHYAPVRDTRHTATARATRLLTSDEPAKTKRAAWSAVLHG